MIPGGGPYKEDPDGDPDPDGGWRMVDARASNTPNVLRTVADIYIMFSI